MTNTFFFTFISLTSTFDIYLNFFSGAFMFLGMVALGNSMYATYRIFKVFSMSVKIVPFFCIFKAITKVQKKKSSAAKKKSIC